MNEALKEAEDALIQGEVPVGCVVVFKGSIISRGHNLTNKESDPLSHAEVVALRSCPSKSKLIFYITCEPCIMCLGILERINAKIFYGCKNSIFGGATILKKTPGIFLEHIKTEKSVKMLQEFFSRENKNAPIEKRISKAKRKKNFL